MRAKEPGDELDPGDRRHRNARPARDRSFPDLARAYLRASGKRRALLPVPLAGPIYRAARAGGHLTPERAVGTGTFKEYLAARSAQRS